MNGNPYLLPRFATQVGKRYRAIWWRFIIPFALFVIGSGRGVEKFDLFLELAAPSLPVPTLSLPGQKFGNIAGLALIVLGTAMVAIAAARFVMTAKTAMPESSKSKLPKTPLLQGYTRHERSDTNIMSQPTPQNDQSDSNPEDLENKLVNNWLAVAVIGLFVFACFYVLKVAVDLFLPIVLASFLGFLLTPVTRWLKKMGFSNFWAPLLGTLSFLFLLICLCAALSLSLAKFEPELPRYLDHIQERLNPILQAVQKSSPSMDRLDGWLNPGKIPQVSIRGPSFLEIVMKNAPRFFAILIIVHVLAFFLLLYGARLLKKLVDMIPGVSEKQNVVEIASEIEQTAARYFTSVTLINAVLGLSVWIFVGLLGLPHPLLWGVAAFLLHYIPFVGATGGIVAMTLVSQIHFDSAWYALLPPLAYLVCAMIEGNLATPLFLGRWLVLNPIAILLTFLLWSYLWGVAGTLLAVPLLATFKIFCDRIKPLRRVGSLLGRP